MKNVTRHFYLQWTLKYNWSIERTESCWYYRKSAAAKKRHFIYYIVLRRWWHTLAVATARNSLKIGYVVVTGLLMSEKSEKLSCDPKFNKHDEVCKEMTQIYTFLFYIAKTRISTKLKRTVFGVHCILVRTIIFLTFLK